MFQLLIRSAAVSSTLICVAILVNSWEGWAASQNAQRWVAAILFQLELTRRQVLGHAEDEHMCSALVHMCGEVRFHLLWRVCVYSWLRHLVSLVPSQT